MTWSSKSPSACCCLSSPPLHRSLSRLHLSHEQWNKECEVLISKPWNLPAWTHTHRCCRFLSSGSFPPRQRARQIRSTCPPSLSLWKTGTLRRRRYATPAGPQRVVEPEITDKPETRVFGAEWFTSVQIKPNFFFFFFVDKLTSVTFGDPDFKQVESRCECNNHFMITEWPVIMSLVSEASCSFYWFIFKGQN